MLHVVYGSRLFAVPLSAFNSTTIQKQDSRSGKGARKPVVFSNAPGSQLSR